jgi:Fe-Mn family superoxide dismutase
MSFSLPTLKYGYNALEPVIDEATMKIHHGKHHQAYTDKFNGALEGSTELASLNIEQILASIAQMPADKQGVVRNNGGGYYNHCLFWEVLSPESTSSEDQLSGELADMISNEFGSLNSMKEKFEAAAVGQFGSGWAWLVYSDGTLKISGTPNQDNPLMAGLVGIQGVPILGLDVWEHAYYLKYQNRRPDYCKAFWSIVNWDRVASNLNRAKTGDSVIGY